MEIIRSSQNATIRRLVGLRNNRRRRAAGIILVDGAREIRRAVEAGLVLRGFYEHVNASGHGIADGPDWQFLRSHAVDAGVHRGIWGDLFSKVCYGDAVDRCVAEFEAPGDSVSDLPPLSPGLILVLDGVEKPGNVGAVFRTADAAGVSAVLLSDCPSDRFNSNAIRGSLGAVFTVPSAAGSQHEIADFLAREVDAVMAMRVEGSQSLYDVSLRSTGPHGRIAVVLGSEADGLGDRWQSWPRLTADNRADIANTRIGGIHLPMAGRVDSLNISVSAAVVAYEAVRQRHNS